MMSNIILFYGSSEPGDSVDVRSFSNWSPSNLSETDIKFISTEQYLMWRKAILFNDMIVANDILKVSTLDYVPWKRKMTRIKRLGREVSRFNLEIWERERYNIMRQGLYLKFSQNIELTHILLNTGDKIIAEASSYDKIWGIGMAASNPAAKTPANWKGLNLLGKALMDVRTQLSNEIE